MEHHVASYCLTPRHPLCSYFQGTDVAPSVTTEPEVKRRRSVRIPDRNTFRFSEITAFDQTGGRHQDDAWTIDRSDHGIRFATRHLLRPDTILDFTVESDDTTATLQGRGRVVWSQALDNSPLFHAGIALLDRSAALP